MDREALQGALAYLQRGCRRAKTVEAVHQMHAGLQSRLGCPMTVEEAIVCWEDFSVALYAQRWVAVDDGFLHAMNAIVDSNVSTILTALILYAVGTGPVQGFAITLIIGIIASMVSAILTLSNSAPVSRQSSTNTGLPVSEFTTQPR